MMDEKNECPLCLDPLELDDISFYPCDCGYQICRFCWTRINNEENGLCPACRQTYNTEKPAFFKPISNEELYRMKKEKKKKEQLKKGKSLADSRKYLADLRVVQTNLIFVVGIPIRHSMDVNLLSSSEYFGRYGKIFKLVVNHNNTFIGPQGQQCVSAYVTYKRKLDAMQALLDLNKRQFDSRQLKVSLGTTKYCSQFLKGVLCTKVECMYLHELGEEEASFTKEEMQQGKHTEYEQKLIAEFITTNQEQLEETERIDWEGKSSTDHQINKMRHDSACSAAMPFDKFSARMDLLEDCKEFDNDRKLIASLNIAANISPIDQSSSQASPFLNDSLLSVDTKEPGACWASSSSAPSDVRSMASLAFTHTDPSNHNNRASSLDTPSHDGLPACSDQSVQPHQTTNLASIDIDEEHTATYDFDPFRESQEGLAELIEKERTMYNLMVQEQHRQQQINSLTDSMQNFSLSQSNHFPSFHRSFTTEGSSGSGALSNQFYQSTGQQTSSSGFMFSNSNVSSSYPPAHNNYINSRGFSSDQAALSYNSQYLMGNRQPKLPTSNNGSLFSAYSLGDQSSSSFSSDSQNFSQYGVNNQFQSSAILDFPNSIKHPEDLNMQEFHDALRSILPHANISIKSPSNNVQQDLYNMPQLADFPNNTGSSVQENYGNSLGNLSTNQKIPSPNSQWNGYPDFPPNQFSQKYIPQSATPTVNSNNNNIWCNNSFSNYMDSSNTNFNSVYGPPSQPPLGINSGSSNYRNGGNHGGTSSSSSSSTMFQNRVISQTYSSAKNFLL